MQVEIWSDVVCPWCYLGKYRFEQALVGFPHRDRSRCPTAPSSSTRRCRRAPRQEAELGATGVPLFVIDGRYGVSGAQPADVLRQALERAYAG